MKNDSRFRMQDASKTPRTKHTGNMKGCGMWDAGCGITISVESYMAFFDTDSDSGLIKKRERNV